jgi:hypothetical protein
MKLASFEAVHPCPEVSFTSSIRHGSTLQLGKKPNLLVNFLKFTFDWGHT